MKLALGTVQFGLDYGIANQGGQVTREEAAAILRHGRSVGLDTLDTAMAYGDSERRLGAIGIDAWQVISKLPGIPDGGADVSGWVQTAIQGSLERLRIPRLAGLLLHRPDQLLSANGPQLYAALQQLKADGLVEKIGVSIYGPSELDALCPVYHFDLVQAPFNLLDRRMIETGWLQRLADQQTEVHVRSVFLQGLLLMANGQRPPRFDRWAPLWAALDGWLDEAGLTPVEACIRDALSVPPISKVVVGVDSLTQLTEIVQASEGPPPVIPEAFRTHEPDLLNPARWPSPV